MATISRFHRIPGFQASAGADVSRCLRMGVEGCVVAGGPCRRFLSLCGELEDSRAPAARWDLQNSTTALITNSNVAAAGGLRVCGSRQFQARTQQRCRRAWSRSGQPRRALDIHHVLRTVEIFLLAGLAAQIKHYRKNFARRFASFSLMRCEGFFSSGGQRNRFTTGATIDSRVLLRCACLTHGTPQFAVN
jgi:hypothetical protein